MRLAVVVPGDNLHEPRGKLQDRVPAIIPEGVCREDEVFAVGDLGSEMSEEPGRCGCMGLAAV